MTETAQPTTTPFGNPDGPVTPDLDAAYSVVDAMLNLDAFLSGDIRLAERTFTFCTAPDLEAEVDRLEVELDSLTDAQGRPLAALASVDAAVGEVSDRRTPQVVAAELIAARTAWYKACAGIRVRQMNTDDWQAWEAKYGEAVTEGATSGKPYPPEVFESLIVACAVAPRFTVDKVRAFRARVGYPVYLELGRAAYGVNTSSGVSLPKSLLSSVATRLTPHA